MSVLETPRIYFRGEVSWDPIVTNNKNTFYDEDTSRTVFKTVPDRVKAFRKSAIAAVPGGIWNPDGTHRSSFYDSAISGADLGGGVVQDDKFVGSPANFVGMLVDLEPYGATSSQLFFDGMSFGIAGGYRIAARRSTRFTARYINFGRNSQGVIAGLASVVWKTTFGKTDGLQIDAFDSKALQELKKSLDNEDVLGLTVQWNAYRTIYYNTPLTDNDDVAPFGDKLAAKLKTGGFQPNPARSMMVGVIGLWRKGEPIHEPCDRTLTPDPLARPYAPTVATVHARLANDSITLDLSNSVSEDNLELVKHNFGDLTVAATDSHGASTTLATLKYADYDREAYLRTSGIVTLKINPAAATIAKTTDLSLTNASKAVSLTETAIRALPIIPNQYVDQNKPQTARFQVYNRGAIAGAGITVPVIAVGQTLTPKTYATDASGMISFPLDASAGGLTFYVPFGDAAALAKSGLNPQIYTYLYARTLPANDDVAKMPPTWETVYALVLSNWHAMAPCMDNWLNLGDAAQVRSFAPMIKKLTSPEAFENFRYMPVTRDLTAGQRTLLYRFLDGEAVTSDQTTLGAEQPEEEPVNFTKLSRSLR